MGSKGQSFSQFTRQIHKQENFVQKHRLIQVTKLMEKNILNNEFRSFHENSIPFDPFLQMHNNKKDCIEPKKGSGERSKRNRRLNLHLIQYKKSETWRILSTKTKKLFNLDVHGKFQRKEMVIEPNKNPVKMLTVTLTLHILIPSV